MAVNGVLRWSRAETQKTVDSKPRWVRLKDSISLRFVLDMPKLGLEGKDVCSVRYRAFDRIIISECNFLDAFREKCCEPFYEQHRTWSFDEEAETSSFDHVSLAMDQFIGYRYFEIFSWWRCMKVLSMIRWIYRKLPRNLKNGLLVTWVISASMVLNEIEDCSARSAWKCWLQFVLK